ncbi:uncharacterized protein PAE49_022293 [Odontesthes bonariensis]|uniref:uncharacterized protein LOC142370261 n=1 Tax=Odontesthes bonariensis TaxID=219752 RepID=UPI003F58604F
MKRRLRSTSSLVSQGQGTSTDPSEEKKEMHPGQKDEIKHTDSKGQMGSPDKDYYGKKHELKGREKRVRNKMRAKPHWHSQDKYSNIPQSKLVEGKGLKVGFNTTDPLMHVCDDDAKPHKLRRRERTVKGKTGDIDSGNYRGNLQDLPLSYYSSGPLLFPDWLHNIPLYKSATPTTAATQLVDNWLDKDYLEEEHMLKETEKKTGGEIREPQIDYPGRNYDGKQHELKGREKNTGANTDVATSTMLQDLSALPDHSKPDLWVSSQSPSCINDFTQLPIGRAQPLMGSQSKDDEGKQHELKGREKARTLVPPIKLDHLFKYYDGKQLKFERRRAQPLMGSQSKDDEGKQHKFKRRKKTETIGGNTDVATSTMLQDLSVLPDHSKPDLWVSSQSPSCINDSPQLSFGRAQPLMSSQSKGDEGKQLELKGREKTGTRLPPIELDHLFKYFDGIQHEFERRRAQPLMGSQSKDDEGKQLKFKRRRAQPLMGSQSKDDEGKQHELKGREKAGTLVPPIELDRHFKYFDGKQHKFKRRKKTETTVANTDVATSTMLQDLSVLPDHRKPDLWVSSQSPSCINDSPQLSLGRAQPLMSSQSKDDEGKQHELKGRKKAGTRLLSIHFLDPLNPSVGPWTVRQPITGTHLPPKDEGKRTGSGLSSVQSETMSGGSGEFPGETDTLLTILTKPKNLCTKAQKVFTPDFTEDFDDEAYMFQCSSPGLYQCSVSGLVFHMEGEGEVLYRIVPWNRRLLRQHHKKPAGPLFDIKCLQQSVCQLHLPHCEILSTGGSNFLSVAHITDDGIEFISPHKITETHVIINITGFSGFGNVKDEDSPPDPVNALVLLFYKLPDNLDVRSLLNVLLVPRNIVIRDLQRTRRKLIGDERYIDASPHCRLQPKQVYSLSTDLGSELVKVQPTEAEFDEESHNSYFTSFQVILKNIISVINLRVENTSSSCCAWEREVCLFPSTVAAPNVRPVDRMLTIRRSFIEGISGAVLQSLVDKLLETKVITDSEREAAEENRSRRDKAQYVFDTVRRKGDAASSKMIEFLREADPFFCDHVGLT